MRRRILLALAFAGATGCAGIGRPWPDLSEKQRAERAAWEAELVEHVSAILERSGWRIDRTGATPAVPPGGRLDTIVLELLVDRLGEVKLVRVPDASVVPGTDKRLLSLITAAGPLPAPPPSLVAFGERLAVRVTLKRPLGRLRPQKT